MNDDADFSPGRHRANDHLTSMAGASSVAYRAGSQKAKLLVVYKAAGQAGLTDEEAATLAGLTSERSCCWWKRCSELRQAGDIEQVPGDTRAGDAGVPRLVSRYKG